MTRGNESFKYDHLKMSDMKLACLQENDDF